MRRAEKTLEEEIQDKIRDRLFESGYLISHVVIFKMSEKSGFFYIVVEGDQGLTVIERGKYSVSGNSIMIQLTTGETFYI
ncbi:hypothetical protein AFV8_gp11 [Betalipothrixvirus puteoliense]|uniref:Cyclic nucleotide-binding domain-containing protein n=1 Tax=Betalipothrixvirus puteoliense TaxID=346884 RepID=A7WKU1_9VIRU|nr:hypothetical protein AFV8_gp11 [Acidianus filamentous virus 8]CAJ31688.1 conserved hypothetical protein [Acidianus filamentous virus 8]